MYTINYTKKRKQMTDVEEYKLYKKTKRRILERKLLLHNFNNKGSVVYGFEEKFQNLYKKGIELGDSSASSNLAKLYLNGKGVEKNTKIGLELLENAASKNNTFALNELGYFYLNGIHVNKNYKKALKKLGMNATIENTQNVTLDGLKQVISDSYNQWIKIVNW